MPANMSVRESHDIALQLQHRVCTSYKGPCEIVLIACSPVQSSQCLIPYYAMMALVKEPVWVCQVEGFDEVERAFVHVDYERRDEPEHKARPLSGKGW